jgi:Alternative complex III, ActD subunit
MTSSAPGVHTIGNGNDAVVLWGLVAEFDTAAAVLHAAENVRDEGYTRFDVHSPIPIHGLDEAMGLRMTRLPWFVLLGGATGAAVALLLQWWTNGVNYPFIISSKPLFGLPANIPITFELTVLFAAIGAFVGMLAANGLPRLYHPLFKVERFRRASDDRFFVSIEAADPKFDPVATRAFLESLGGGVVEPVEA